MPSLLDIVLVYILSLFAFLVCGLVLMSYRNNVTAIIRKYQVEDYLELLRRTENIRK